MKTKKIFLITGGTSGIGRVAAQKIAETGATLVITSRNMEKGNMIVNEISKLSNNLNIEVMHCDFTSFQSIKQFTEKFKTKYSVLDVLINNAGVWETEFKETQDGIEANFAVNHLAPFLLTNLLLENIKLSEQGRIINTSSLAHAYIDKVNFDDIEFRKGFNSMQSYRQSKLCNILFTNFLAKILQTTDITVNCLHPGIVETKLFDNFNENAKNSILQRAVSVEEGAETTVYLALSDDVKKVSGKYFHGHKTEEPSQPAKDLNAAEKLWNISLNYVSKYL